MSEWIRCAKCHAWVLRDQDMSWQVDVAICSCGNGMTLTKLDPQRVPRPNYGSTPLIPTTSTLCPYDE